MNRDRNTKLLGRARFYESLPGRAEPVGPAIRSVWFAAKIHTVFFAFLHGPSTKLYSGSRRAAISCDQSNDIYQAAADPHSAAVKGLDAMERAWRLQLPIFGVAETRRRGVAR